MEIRGRTRERRFLLRPEFGVHLALYFSALGNAAGPHTFLWSLSQEGEEQSKKAKSEKMGI